MIEELVNRYYLGGRCVNEITIIIFLRKNFFQRKRFNSLVDVFFLFLKLPMTRRVQVCRVRVLYDTYVGCYSGLDAGGGGFKFRLRSYFLRLFRYSLTRSQFLTTKIRVFSTKNIWFFGKWVFCQKLPLFRRNWNKWFFFKLFENLRKKFGIPEKTEKFTSYKSIKKSVGV